ncbi:MAG: Tat pathway signal protein [Pseudomonadota bacterium]
MPKLNRRTFLASAAAAGSLRTLPIVSKPPTKRILTLVYDKSLGMMRAIDRVVP